MTDDSRRAARDVGRLVVLFRPHRRQAAFAVLAMLGVAVFTAFVAYLFQPLFDEVLSPEARIAITKQGETGLGAATPLKTLAGSGDLRAKMPLIRWLDGRLADLFRAAGVTRESRGAAILFTIFLAFLAKNVCSYFALAHFNTVGLAFVRDLRATLYDRLLGQSTSFFARNPSGDLISRVTGDVDRIQSLFGTDLADLAQSLATLSSLVVLVVSLSPELTLIALVIAPAIVVPVVVIANRLRKISKAGRERMGDLTSVLAETIRGQRVVQAYGAERYEAGRFGEVNERTFRLARRAARIMAFSSPLLETASVLAFLLLLAYAGSRIAADKMTLGTFISFGVGLVMMYQPFKRATRINLALQTALASARRLFEILDAPVDVVDGPEARPLPAFAREIRFDGVSFAYPGEGPVLHGIDLVVPRGSVTALVGPSGAGKTTLVNLVPRFMDATAGTVTVDGLDVRLSTLSSLRGQIGLVTQDVILFDDTVRHNVAYGRKDVPEGRIRAALDAANALGFVEELPRGLDTRVGESGARLSGGQRQRLAIARALLKDPPILILDEATSSLDTESERAVQQALERLMAGRTVIVIAHRLSTVRRADQLIVLDAGRIVERGAHAGLLAAGGLYRRLHDLQLFEPESGREVSAS
ncbi:MAG TPA: ABC transporter ATP-binding protein [Thermoanaerobaculia bacterium]|nr:ABC transporter ATP-binding protein [Thermoanaerobaculia bacterium]